MQEYVSITILLYIFLIRFLECRCIGVPHGSNQNCDQGICFAYKERMDKLADFGVDEFAA